MSQSKKKHYPKALKKIRSKKFTIWKQYKANVNDTKLKISYNKICAEYKRAVRCHEIEIEKKVITDNNPSSFYNFVNKKLQPTSNINTLIDRTGKEVTEDYDKANLLNQFFMSVGTVDDGRMPELILDTVAQTDCSLEDISFDPLRIIQAAKKIKTKNKTSCDHEGFPVILITKMISILCFPLSLIYSSFFSIG